METLAKRVSCWIEWKTTERRRRRRRGKSAHPGEA